MSQRRLGSTETRYAQLPPPHGIHTAPATSAAAAIRSMPTAQRLLARPACKSTRRLPPRQWAEVPVWPRNKSNLKPRRPPHPWAPGRQGQLPLSHSPPSPPALQLQGLPRRGRPRVGSLQPRTLPGHHGACFWDASASGLTRTVRRPRRALLSGGTLKCTACPARMSATRAYAHTSRTLPCEAHTCNAARLTRARLCQRCAQGLHLLHQPITRRALRCQHLLQALRAEALVHLGAVRGSRRHGWG